MSIQKIISTFLTKDVAENKINFRFAAALAERYVL